MSFPIRNDPEEGIPRVKITKTREGVLTVGLILQKCRRPQLMAPNACSNQVAPEDEDGALGRRRSLRQKARKSLPDATVWCPYKARSQRSNLRNGASFDPSGVDHDYCSYTDESSTSKYEEEVALSTDASPSYPQGTDDSSRPRRVMLAAEESNADPQNNTNPSQEAGTGNRGNTAVETEDVTPALAQNSPLPFDVVDIDNILSDVAEAPQNESGYETQPIATIKLESSDSDCIPPVFEVKEESKEETEYYSGPLSRKNRSIAMYTNVHNRRAKGSTTLCPAMVCTEVETVIHMKCESDEQCEVCAIKVENERHIKPFCWICAGNDEVQTVGIIAVHGTPVTHRVCKVEGDDNIMSTVKTEECGPVQSGSAEVSSLPSEVSDPLEDSSCPNTDVADPVAILGMANSSSFSGNRSETMIGGPPLCIGQNEDGDCSMEVMPAENVVTSDEGDTQEAKLQELIDSADIEIDPMDVSDELSDLLNNNSDDAMSSEAQTNTSTHTTIEDSCVQDVRNGAELPIESIIACTDVSDQQKTSPKKCCGHTNVLVQVHQPTSGNLSDTVYIPEEQCTPFGYERFTSWRNAGPKSPSHHVKSNHSCQQDHLHHKEYNHHHYHEVHHHHHHHYHHHHDDNHHHESCKNSMNTDNNTFTPGSPPYDMVSTQCKNIVKTSACDQSQAPSPQPNSEKFDSTSSAPPQLKLHSDDAGKVAYPYLDYIADRTVCQGFHPVEVNLIAEDLARNGRLSVQLFNSHHHLVRKFTGFTSFRHLEHLREYLPQIKPVYCSTAQEEFLLFMIKLCTNCSNRDLARWSGLSEEDAENMFLEVVTSLARAIRDSPQYLWPTAAHLEANIAWRAGAETPDSFTQLPMGCEDEVDLKKNYYGLEHVFRVLKQDLAEYETDILGLCHSVYIINQMLPYQGFYPAADESVCKNCKEGPYARKESEQHGVA